MTVNLMLKPEVEGGLVAQAHANGMSVEEYVLRVLKETCCLRPGRIVFLLDTLSVLVKAVLVQDQLRRTALAVGYKSDLGVDIL